MLYVTVNIYEKGDVLYIFLFNKEIDDSRVTVTAVVSDEYTDLFVQTMYTGKKEPGTGSKPATSLCLWGEPSMGSYVE